METKNYFFQFGRVGFRPKVWGEGGAVEVDGKYLRKKIQHLIFLVLPNVQDAGGW